MNVPPGTKIRGYPLTWRGAYWRWIWQPAVTRASVSPQKRPSPRHFRSQVLDTTEIPSIWNKKEASLSAGNRANSSCKTGESDGRPQPSREHEDGNRNMFDPELSKVIGRYRASRGSARSCEQCDSCGADTLCERRSAPAKRLNGRSVAPAKLLITNQPGFPRWIGPT